MKYRCFCHVEDFWDLTSGEVTTMIRSEKRFRMGQVAEYYKIPLDDIYKFLDERGIKTTQLDRNSIMVYEKKITKEEARDITRKQKPFKTTISMNVSDWPKSLVCALGDVDFEVIENKRMYDVEGYSKAVENLQRKINNYFNENPDHDTEYSKLKKNDLIAMRYYRGFKRSDFAKLVGVSIAQVKEMENTSPVTKEVAKIYQKNLNVNNVHIAQLRKVMKGTLNEVKDNRHIPKGVKVLVYGRDGGRCTECRATQKLHYHHIERYADGGQNTAENIKLLCAYCHAEEHKGEQAYSMLKSMAEKE